MTEMFHDNCTLCRYFKYLICAVCLMQKITPPPQYLWSIVILFLLSSHRTSASSFSAPPLESTRSRGKEAGIVEQTGGCHLLWRGQGNCHNQTKGKGGGHLRGSVRRQTTCKRAANSRLRDHTDLKNSGINILDFFSICLIITAILGD